MTYKEVAVYCDETQFEPKESPEECGFFGVALNRAAGEKEVTLTHEEIDQLADTWYTRLNGLNTATNYNGMTLPELYVTLQWAGIHYRGFRPDMEMVKAWSRAGYPVMIAVIESSVYDLEIGKVPYAWKPTGSHIITVTGVENNNLLVRDTANIGATGIRPGPRLYDANKLKLVSSTALVLSWMHVPALDFNPLVHEPPKPKEITVDRGDTLWSLALDNHTTMANLLAKNEETLDREAQKRGFRSSENGNLIFPGTVLIV